MTNKELIGTVIFFILAVLTLTGCENSTLAKGRPVYFYHKNMVNSQSPTLSADKLQNGLDWFDQLGYDFNMTLDESVAEVIVFEVVWDEDWIGQADPDNNTIKMVRGLKDWTNHVLAHEVMHLLGVGHIENVYPGLQTCNIMNGSGTDYGCGPMTDFTDLDLELYARQAD